MMLLLGLRRADALREASARQEAGLEEHPLSSCPWREYTFVPGLMTGMVDGGSGYVCVGGVGGEEAEGVDQVAIAESVHVHASLLA
eukprot:1146131-Pelagomonas_calceolata.AAC.1